MGNDLPVPKKEAVKTVKTSEFLGLPTIGTSEINTVQQLYCPNCNTYREVGDV